MAVDISTDETTDVQSLQHCWHMASRASSTCGHRCWCASPCKWMVNCPFHVSQCLWDSAKAARVDNRRCCGGFGMMQTTRQASGTTWLARSAPMWESLPR